MADIIQVRRDTAANWTSVNPTLAEGEFAVETDTNQFKIGDGVTAWTSLTYVTQGPAATIAVGTTTTGAEGTNASVVNSGNTAAAVFDFTIPRGDTGAQGPQGIQGPAGTPGNLWSLNGLTAEYLSGGATVGGVLTATGGSSTDWNTAFGWGDHSAAGYLTSYTETDPVFTASAASGITATNISNWNTAYGWGNHASAGYLPLNTSTYSGTYNIPIITSGYLYPNPVGGGVTITGSSGSLTASGNITAYSDSRLKENVEVIPNALDKVLQIRGVTFTRNDQEDKETRYAGVIAQEVEAVLPEVVAEDDEGIKNVAYGNIVGLLIEAIKDLKAEVEELKDGVTDKRADKS